MCHTAENKLKCRKYKSENLLKSLSSSVHFLARMNYWRMNMKCLGNGCSRTGSTFVYLSRHMNFWYFNWMMWSALARLVDHCSVKDGNCICFSHRERHSEYSYSLPRFCANMLQRRNTTIKWKKKEWTWWSGFMFFELQHYWSESEEIAMASIAYWYQRFERLNKREKSIAFV